MILILLAYLLLYFTTDLFPGPGGGFPGGFFMGLAAAAGPVLIIAGGFVLNQLYRLKKMIDRLLVSILFSSFELHHHQLIQYLYQFL